MCRLDGHRMIVAEKHFMFRWEYSVNISVDRRGLEKYVDGGVRDEAESHSDTEGPKMDVISYLALKVHRLFSGYS